MPLSTELAQEGVVIDPQRIRHRGELVQECFNSLTAHDSGSARGDYLAQMGANDIGVDRMSALVKEYSPGGFADAVSALNDYARKLAGAALEKIPDGVYRFSDVMDDDGYGTESIPVQVTMTRAGNCLKFDFEGTGAQVKGNINCPLTVTAAALYYVWRCLLPADAPDCKGLYHHLQLVAQEGCLVNAQYPAAVVAGNVETSQRLVDVLLGALHKVPGLSGRLPAASYGGMNNVAMGSATEGRRWDYYETLAGGTGAGAGRDGLTAVQAHMTNTLNTPVESLETHYPLRICQYAIRRGSGGSGDYRGGDGLVREYEFLQPAEVTLVTERRLHAPWGINGAGSAAPGENRLNGKVVPGKCHLRVESGDTLTVLTPGGGGCNHS
jgi:N-methylhydantoinase B